MGQLAAYLYSLAIGLLVGRERERSYRGRSGQAYGIRTFALLCLVGTLATEAGATVVAVALSGVVALLVVGYRRTSSADPGTTTEVAAMATFLLGVLSYHDSALAAALAIGIVALLMSKDRLHRFVSDVLSDVEMEDALKFLVGAFVILPLSPRRGVDPSQSSIRRGSGCSSSFSPRSPGSATSACVPSGRVADCSRRAWRADSFRLRRPPLPWRASPGHRPGSPRRSPARGSRAPRPTSSSPSS